jgi:uncharacterized protein DUF6932
LTFQQHNNIVVLLIPPFQSDGNLPPGIHRAEWAEIETRFALNPHRRRLLQGFREAILNLKGAGCKEVFLDGSYVTAKDTPGDYDSCWSVIGVNPNGLDPVFFDFDNKRAAQKARYQGEFFPAEMPEGASGKAFLEFFQIDKDTTKPKGIVGLNLERWKP